jgi:hypothetical protein
MDPRLVRAFEKGESVDFDEVMGMDAPSGAPASSADGGDEDNNSSNGNSRRPPRVKVSPFTSSARIEEKMLEDEHDRIAKLEEAVRELLDLCARYVCSLELVVCFSEMRCN